MDIHTAVQVHLEDQGIGTDLSEHKDGYWVLKCTDVGDNGVNVHINFTVEDCKTGETEDTSLDDLPELLKEWV